jgi:2-oxoglutarate dehydrogenase E2 component (dihydrolipoamide succinyltransferase)
MPSLNPNPDPVALLAVPAALLAAPVAAPAALLAAPLAVPAALLAASLAAPAALLAAPLAAPPALLAAPPASKATEVEVTLADATTIKATIPTRSDFERGNI